MKNTTIAAVSTPFGRGGIAVIRISGEDAVSVASKMFIPARGCDLSAVKGGQAVYGSIVSGGEFIDDGIATVFLAPKSFTGEDTVEISCHGGILLTERVLKTAFDCGAVPAGAGEFSQRAFMNGKIDLSGAEAIIGLIDAESEEKLRLSASHSRGVLKERCNAIYERIMHLLASVYVKLDYPEEDLSEVSDGEFIAELEAIREMLLSTEGTYKQGKAVSEGVRTAIIGKPNVGKSSLLNALIGENKAIVTSVAGTTRDVIEETVTAGRVILRLFDTAGIRESDDEVERIGIERALEKASEAELIVAVMDTSRPLDDEDGAVLDILSLHVKNGLCAVCVLSKSDISPVFGISEVTGAIVSRLGSEKLPENLRFCSVSARDGKGVDELKKIAEAFFCEGYVDYQNTAVVANARQFSAVSGARKSIENAIAAFEGGMGADVCGLDLEGALRSIGQVDGRSVADEITNEIFHRFCVGK